ncbi:MAG: VacJ family lipoprotein [Alphaproteobacteria bacterium]|nr:VacJ family lipoprotein [Alphaproteobacteria bacterium]
MKQIFSIGRSGILTAALAALLLGGCASRPSDPDALAYYLETGDPLEPMNRAIFQFNEITDKVILRPAAIGYRAVVPKGVRAGIHNFLNNMKSPITILNALLQGEGVRARDTFGRFMTNTILGLGGLIDIASDAGIPQHYEDFGQTLAVWGVEPGPYLVLPLLGPSNFRDGIGAGIDGAIDPFGRYISNEYGPEGAAVRYTLNALDWRASNLKTIDDLRNSSLDFYATVRSGFRQRRAHDIRNGRLPDGDFTGGPGVIDFDNMDMDMEPPPDGAPENGKTNNQ